MIFYQHKMYGQILSSRYSASVPPTLAECFAISVGGICLSICKTLLHMHTFVVLFKVFWMYYTEVCMRVGMHVLSLSSSNDNPKFRPCLGKKAWPPNYLIWPCLPLSPHQAFLYCALPHPVYLCIPPFVSHLGNNGWRGGGFNRERGPL